MQFTPNKDFFSEETKSQYVVGLSYFCKDDADHAKLKDLLPRWIKEGKVRLGPASVEDIKRHLPGRESDGEAERQQLAASDVGAVESVLSGKGVVK